MSATLLLLCVIPAGLLLRAWAVVLFRPACERKLGRRSDDALWRKWILLTVALMAVLPLLLLL